MTKERENEIRQLSRDEQEDLLFELRKKYSAQPVLPNQTSAGCSVVAIGNLKSACGTRRAVVAASFFPDHGQSTWRVLKDM